MRPAIIFLLIAFCSCTTEKQTEVAIEIRTGESETKPKMTPDQKKTSQNESPAITEAPNEAPGVEVALKFDALVMTTRFEEIWNEEGYLNQIHDDTILIQLGLGNGISGQTYSIKIDSSVQSIEIFQNYETSLTLMNEGPHVDLTGWKHYNSDWEKLDVSNNEFKTLEYPDSDQTKFPNVTSDEIVQAVKNSLGTESGGWIALAEKCKGANHYPCGISISRINLKIVVTGVNGIKTKKFVIFEIPMGC